jgi:HEAT repeat protein
MTTSEVQALFEQTLTGGYDDEAPLAAVSALRRDGSRDIFDHAAAWCLSDHPLKRARAADILCQLRRASGAAAEPLWMFRDESYSLITKMLETERDAAVIDSAIHALGHLHNAEAIPRIPRYRDHAHEDVRFAVACALGSFPNDPDSVSGLLKLTSDADREVRDWAVFGLGVLGDTDSPEVREALLRCLDDPDVDVREEPAVGLGRRRDPRLLPKLMAMLDDGALKVRVAEGASALLGFEKDPPEWVAEDYKSALRSKFQI